MNDGPARASPAAEGERERLSQTMRRLRDEAGPTISLREIADAMDERSFGAFLFVFCLPSLIPMPPGATLVLGLPLIFIAWQIAAGRSEIWLPERLARYSFKNATFARIVDKSTPWLLRIENWIRPRHWHLGDRAAERLFGFYTLLLAFAVVVPIPFGNWLPAVAIAIMSLAYTERDGIWMIAGAAVGVASLAVAAAICVATGEALSFLL